MKKQLNQFRTILAPTIVVAILVSFSGCINNQNPTQADLTDLNNTPKNVG